MVDWQTFARLYLPLIGWIGLGLVLGRTLPSAVPMHLGKVLFWVGVPLSIMIFIRQSDFSLSVWLAPIVAWLAVLLGIGFAWSWIHLQLVSPHSLHRRASQGSFLLSAMVGNTGYLGYPVALTLVGPQYFGWAVLYDTLGSTLAAYGLGVVLAAYFGQADRQTSPNILLALIKNPALWSFWLGLAGRSVLLSPSIEQSLRGLGWGVIALSLLLLGMRLSQLRSWHHVQPASISLGIKMLIVPLVGGYGLRWLGITGAPLLVLVLQMSMPPAFATLIITEAYNLDRELSVTALAIGSALILLTLPVWLWLFGGS
ncbi:AEC family transporter [Thermocoleostomius sinensis]|uniref:AEC family transporter n=1 Tax=Thermocoleostomius sinensis A174 TaxID=2016057 RepID=A0A9E9C7Q2_9CYAN|nr:AEC family transporter [Thermocoleostomius sinensis]WAL59463.1 AEC family transporter [Thermocoleostomius sinensis A174]